MANNKLYIVDTETGDRVLLAKSMGDGWYIWTGASDDSKDSERIECLTNWLDSRDLEVSYGNVFTPKKTNLRLMCESEETPAYDEADLVRIRKGESALTDGQREALELKEDHD